MPKTLLSLVSICISAFLFAGTFAPGNIVVVRVGAGIDTLSSASTAVFLDEYTTTGTLVQSIALPTAVSGSDHALTLSGVATSEGSLNLSVNGQYLTLAGYDTTIGYASVSSGITNRTIARVDASGAVNTSTGYLSGSAYKKNNIRSAVTNDGNEFWTAGTGTGTTGGVWYVPFGSFTGAGIQTSTTNTNTRFVNITNGQLYFGTASVATGIYTDGTGLVTTTGQTEAILPGLPTLDSLSSPYAFMILEESTSVPSQKVLYVVDDDETAPYGGIYKYSLVGGTWVTNGNIPNANGLRGITGYQVCDGTELYVTAGNGIYTFFDSTGYNQTIRGSYTQIVTAATNTVVRGIAFAPGTITPSAPDASIVSTSNVTCFGKTNGAINISVTGGTSPLTYSWTGGSTSQNPTNLASGIYIVTVTDHYGCRSTAIDTITQPSALYVSVISGANISCYGGNNGSITVAAAGGTPGYTYQWIGGNTDSSRIGLTSGSYTVTVTDHNSCSALVSATLTQPNAISIAIDSITNLPCTGGSTGAISISVSGGTTPYHYDWTPGSITTQNISGISAGTYHVTVIDSNGCGKTDSAIVSRSGSLSLSDSIIDVSCFGLSDGSISVSVTGGTPGYTYSWSGSSNTTPTLTGLAVGSYTLTVSDHAGCVLTVPYSVFQPTQLTLSLTVVNDSTHDGNSGSINAIASGGTGSYSYIWGNTATTENISSLAAGPYCVTVTDQNACTDTACTIVSQPTGINNMEWLNSYTAYTSGGYINIDFAVYQSTHITAEMYDLTGHLIYHSPVVYDIRAEWQISDADISSGCYIIRVLTDQGSVCKKVSVIK